MLTAMSGDIHPKSLSQEIAKMGIKRSSTVHSTQTQLFHVQKTIPDVTADATYAANVQSLRLSGRTDSPPPKKAMNPLTLRSGNYNLDIYFCFFNSHSLSYPQT